MGGSLSSINALIATCDGSLRNGLCPIKTCQVPITGQVFQSMMMKDSIARLLAMDM